MILRGRMVDGDGMVIEVFPVFSASIYMYKNVDKVSCVERRPTEHFRFPASTIREAIEHGKEKQKYLRTWLASFPLSSTKSETKARPHNMQGAHWVSPKRTIGHATRIRDTVEGGRVIVGDATRGHRRGTDELRRAD